MSSAGALRLLRTQGALFGCGLGAALAMVLVFHALSDPHGLYGLSEYDDAVYLGAALRLVNGELPYRDFVFVQPPGITLLLSPVAGLAHLVGTRDAMVVARVLTGVVAGANAFLGGFLIRHRGALASLCAAVLIAIFPTAYFADHTVLLEPYVVLFCLLGANLAVARPEQGWRIITGGICFALAISVKLWSIVPIIVALACIALVAPRYRRQAARCTLVVAFAVVVIFLPFFAFAPHAFFRDIVTAQLAQQVQTSQGFILRLWSLLGLRGFSVALTYRRHRDVAIVVGIIAVVVLGKGLLVALTRRDISRVEVFALGAAVATFVTLLIPTEFFPHYAYFFAPFAAIALGGAISRVKDALVSFGTAHSSRRIWHNAAPIVGLATLIAAALCVVVTVRDEFHYDRSALGHVPQNFSVIEAAIPAGACTVTDAPGLTLEANRFLSTDPQCPALVDADGTWLADDPTDRQGVIGIDDDALVAAWRSAFARARYVVLSSPNTPRIPWTKELRGYFDANFVPLNRAGATIYVRADTAPRRSSAA